MNYPQQPQPNQTPPPQQPVAQQDPYVPSGGLPMPPMPTQAQPTHQGYPQAGEYGFQTAPFVVPQQVPQAPPQQPAAQPQQFQPTHPNFPSQPAQQAPAPPPQHSPTQIRDILAAQGVPVEDYADDQQLLADIGRTASERDRLQYLARIGQQALTQQQQQQVPGQQPQAPQQPNGQQQQPQWRQEWGALLQRDPETGMYVPKPGNELFAGQIAQIANNREAERREAAERLMDDPLAYLNERGLGSMLEQERQRIIDEIRQQERDRQVLSQVEQFQRELEPLVVQRDQTGQPVINPLTGRPILTELGQTLQAERTKFTNWFQGVYGVEPDDALLAQHVQPIVDNYRQRQQQQQQAQPQLQPAYNPQQDAAWKNQMTIAAAAQLAATPPQGGYQPQPNGTIANAAQYAAVPQNSQMTLEEAIRRAAIEKGLITHDGW